MDYGQIMRYKGGGGVTFIRGWSQINVRGLNPFLCLRCCAQPNVLIIMCRWSHHGIWTLFFGLHERMCKVFVFFGEGRRLVTALLLLVFAMCNYLSDSNVFARISVLVKRQLKHITFECHSCEGRNPRHSRAMDSRLRGNDNFK